MTFFRHLPVTPKSNVGGFNVSCLKCDSHKLRVICEFDSETGDVTVFLFCPCCR